MQKSKSFSVSFFFASLLVAQAAADGAHYGPKNCVSISRSTQGSCVFKTQCQGVDTSKFDFGFSCKDGQGGSMLHSFGIGGFDDVEEYDTEVKCAACDPPMISAMAATANSRAKTEEPAKKEQFQKARYGPDSNCVSTYPSERGTCILATDCKENVLDGVTMGLVCADAKGDMVRHVFSDNSFSHKETFDTLIACTQCLALDNFDSGKDTEEQILKEEVNMLKDDINSLNVRVTKLEQGAAETENKTEEKKDKKREFVQTEKSIEEEKALVHTRLSSKKHNALHHRGHLRRQHKKHASKAKKHHREEGDADLEHADEDEQDQDDSEQDPQNDEDQQDKAEEDQAEEQ